MKHGEHEIFELVLKIWKQRGRPPLADTARILLKAEAMMLGDIEGITARLLMVFVSADEELMEQWTTGTDAERIDAALEAFSRMLTALYNLADHIEAKQRGRDG